MWGRLGRAGNCRAGHGEGREKSEGRSGLPCGASGDTPAGAGAVRCPLFLSQALLRRLGPPGPTFMGCYHMRKGPRTQCPRPNV